MIRLRPASLCVPFLLLVLSLAGGCRDASGYDPTGERPADAASARRFADVEWSRRMRIGGVEDDTTLISPMRLRAGPEGVTVIDFHPRRIQRFSHRGTLRWQFGRKGSGPDEFQDPRDLKIAPDGSVWVLDPANSRVTVLDGDGHVVRRIPVGHVGGSPRQVVPLASGDGLLATDIHDGDPLVQFDSAGRIVERHPFPWEGFRRLDYLATQVNTANRGDSWVMAFSMGDGFFRYTPETQGLRGWYVEPVPFPEVVVERSGNTTTTRHRERPTFAAIGLTLSDERIYVLFGGTTKERGRLVDAYSLRDGAYEQTYLLPEAASEIAWHDGGLYTLAQRPYPELAFWRPEGAGLP